MGLSEPTRLARRVLALEAPNHPPITFAFHDNQTIRPATVRDILCNQVGLPERDALALL